MESTPRRTVLPTDRAVVGSYGCAFGIGMALLGHGRVLITPRKGCG